MLMKKKSRIHPVGRILLIVLAVLVLAAGSFWFYCRVINRRSFMAGFVDLFLTIQHRSDKSTYLDVCEAFIAEKAEANREPVVIEKAKFGISVREDAAGPLQTFVYNDQEHPAQTVFYFHGGAYINQPNGQQTTMAARTAKETGCEVVLMVYPKEPVYDCETAYELCIGYYRSYIEENDCGKIVFMGDSAGGIRMDTMFVDEGFGSLDEESLQQAMKALTGLAESNRLVGIISHVSELKERIDRQIVVTKERSGGSRLQIIV